MPAYGTILTVEVHDDVIANTIVQPDNHLAFIFKQSAADPRAAGAVIINAETWSNCTCSGDRSCLNPAVSVSETYSCRPVVRCRTFRKYKSPGQSILVVALENWNKTTFTGLSRHWNPLRDINSHGVGLKYPFPSNNHIERRTS